MLSLPEETVRVEDDVPAAPNLTSRIMSPQLVVVFVNELPSRCGLDDDVAAVENIKTVAYLFAFGIVGGQQALAGVDILHTGILHKEYL